MWSGIIKILAILFTYSLVQVLSGITVSLCHNRLQKPTPKIPHTWQSPNPGFLAAELINDSDNESNDIVDFDAISDENSSPDYPFIKFEAEEASESEPEQSVFKTARRY